MKYVNIANFSEEEQPKKKKRGLVKKAIIAGAAGAAAYGGYKNRKKIGKKIKRGKKSFKQGLKMAGRESKNPGYANKVVDRFGRMQARKRNKKANSSKKTSAPRQINID